MDDDLITFTPHARAVQAAQTSIVTQPVIADLPLRHRITERGLNDLRDACKGWDRQWLVLQYLGYMDGKTAPRDVDASLVAWGRSFTKGRPPG